VTLSVLPIAVVWLVIAIALLSVVMVVVVHTH
jgi:hypothetical protein